MPCPVQITLEDFLPPPLGRYNDRNGCKHDAAVCFHRNFYKPQQFLPKGRGASGAFDDAMGWFFFWERPLFYSYFIFIFLQY